MRDTSQELWVVGSSPTSPNMMGGLAQLVEQEYKATLINFPLSILNKQSSDARVTSLYKKKHSSNFYSLHKK